MLDVECSFVVALEVAVLKKTASHSRKLHLHQGGALD